jgi:hypothetical protein
MRLFFALVLVSCSNPPAPPEPGVVAAPGPSAEGTPVSPPAEAAAPESKVALPAATPAPGAVPVALVGHGIRLELNPPFQAARLGAFIPDATPDTIVVSWWDVAAEGAGKSGVAGLYNTVVAPGPGVAGDRLIPGTREDRGVITHVLRTVQGGTELRIPDGYRELGGAGRASPGPADAAWKVEFGGQVVEWPPDTMVHSSDPASGPAVTFEKMPRRPWGPWKP